LNEIEVFPQRGSVFLVLMRCFEFEP